MITISEILSLTPIRLSDQAALLALMRTIYPPAYAHYWQDQGDWYLNHIYSPDNLEKELLEKGSEYYFVCYHSSPNASERIGILKVISNVPYPPLPSYKAYKVHRIYLDTNIQGKGIGKTLMQWSENQAISKGHKLIWLDAMDTHPQAQAFYKRLGYEKSELQYLDFELLYDQHRPMWYLHKYV